MNSPMRARRKPTRKTTHQLDMEVVFGAEEMSKLFVTIANLLAVIDQHSSLVLMLNPWTSLMFSSQRNSGLCSPRKQTNTDFSEEFHSELMTQT